MVNSIHFKNTHINEHICLISVYFCCSMIDSSSSSCDEDGIRFLLLSRIVLGRSEIVFPQGLINRSYPSSPEFDSGVDSLTSPKKYIIWSTHMNTHVLPEYVVCIKAPSILRKSKHTKKKGLFPLFFDSFNCCSCSVANLVCFFVVVENPKSPWISFPVLIKSISRFLNLSQILLVQKLYKEHQVSHTLSWLSVSSSP